MTKYSYKAQQVICVPVENRKSEFPNVELAPRTRISIRSWRQLLPTAVPGATWAHEALCSKGGTPKVAHQQLSIETNNVQKKPTIINRNQLSIELPGIANCQQQPSNQYYNIIGFINHFYRDN